MLEHIRLSQSAKDQLLRLKRKTKLQHWNEICRWAFCLSLAEPMKPSSINIPNDSSLEISWRIFGGQYQDIYLAVLKERCRKDGLNINSEILAEQLKLHLHRGIGYLASDIEMKHISHLLKKVSIVPFKDSV
jgi:DNA sulfur modification protein DndE